MNNFNGIINEYSTIAVDCFDGESLQCSVFCLSHCHSDHMKGLGSDAFFNRLNSSSEIKFYCSKVTSDLLVGDSKFKHLKPLMTILDVLQTTTIPIPGKGDSILVTLLPAGHCPGSVMFLFEGQSGNVLYTGDCRLTKNDLEQMQPLFIGDRVKRLCKLYVDTTFCSRSAEKLPTRTQSRDALFHLLDPWLAEGDNCAVYFSCPAQFGCEYLFVELSKRYRMKVHVTRNKMWKYEAVPEILESVTVDGTETRLHACFYKGQKEVQGDTVKDVDKGRVLPCENGRCRKRRTILFVRFSTMWFTTYNTSSNGLVHSLVGDSHRICYSMHSSYEEIVDLVQFLKPRAVHPLVVPKDSTLDEVYRLLKLDLEGLSSQEDIPSIPKEFGSLKNRSLSQSLENGAVDSDLVFGSESISSTPPKKIRRLSNVSEHEIGSPKWKMMISPLKERYGSQQESMASEWNDAGSESSKCSTNYGSANRESQELDLDANDGNAGRAGDPHTTESTVGIPVKSNGALKDLTKPEVPQVLDLDVIEVNGDEMSNVQATAMTAVSAECAPTKPNSTFGNVSECEVLTVIISTEDVTSKVSNKRLALEEIRKSPEVVDLTAEDDEIVCEDDEVLCDDWDSTPELDVVLTKQS